MKMTSTIHRICALTVTEPDKAGFWRGTSFESEFYITECTWMRKHGWRTPEWKLMIALEPDFHFKPEIELYNLVRDPEENVNLAEDEPEMVALLAGTDGCVYRYNVSKKPDCPTRCSIKEIGTGKKVSAHSHHHSKHTIPCISVTQHRQQNVCNQNPAKKQTRRNGDRIMTLKVAIVGMGNIGNRHAQVYTVNLPMLELVAVCDIIEEKSDKAAEAYGCQGFYSVQEMLDSNVEFDAVSVTTAGTENGGDHYEPTMELLRAGYPVLGEKPISNEIPKAEEMVALAKEKNCALWREPQPPLHPCRRTWHDNG